MNEQTTIAVCPARIQTSLVETNAAQGRYRPFFFDLPEFNLSKVDFQSCFFNNDDVEKQLLQGEFTFAYLREDKLRTIDAYDINGEHIPFNNFLSHFGITIRSKNLFKTGKYLSRVFRPIRYGGFFQELDVHINENHTGKVTDGISLISVTLAKELGWENAEENMSAQFTLFFKDGLVKGHCILSDKIQHDVVIYGNENIKTEISLNNGYEYVALEPVKLGEKLRMDIQSMLNLWNLFGAEQFLSWSYTGMQSFKEDLFSGKLTSWLDNFDEINKEDYDNEQWTLRKAIWAKIDYTKYPGLIRLAWTMMKNSIMRYAENLNGLPAFRIPVPEGKRAYIRVDLRNHDANGNFLPTVEEGSVELDRFGNIWIHENDIKEFMEIKGGADQDDSVAIIPVEEGRAVIYRNPNQYGEYGIHKIVSKDIEINHVNKIIGEIPIKEVKEEKDDFAGECFSNNSLLNNFLQTLEQVQSYFIDYNIPNLIRNYTKISENTASIGVAANAEMVRSAIGIIKPKLLKKLTKQFNWNLERIIDSTVKDGVEAKEDMEAVRGLFNHVIENKIKVPKSLLNRFPEKMQSEVSIDTKHPMDLLLDAIKILIERIDLEILGKGSASKGNRIQGMIDHLETPIIQLGLTSINNPLYDLAIGMMKIYNQSIAIMLEETKDEEDREILRKEGVEIIQTGLLKEMSAYTNEERSMIINVMAYEIYKGNGAVHDSILWVGDKDGLRGTASDTIEMLANTGLAYHIKKNGSVKRYAELKEVVTELKQIRVWSKDELRPEYFSEVDNLQVLNKMVIVGELKLNLGDEININNGTYSVKKIAHSYSRKTSRVLKNSLSIYITL